MKPLKFVGILIAIFILIMVGCAIKSQAQGFPLEDRIDYKVVGISHNIVKTTCERAIALQIDGDKFALPFKSQAEYDLWVMHNRTDTTKVKCKEYIDVLVTGTEPKKYEKKIYIRAVSQIIL